MDDLISRKELLESIEKVSVKGNVLDDDWVYRFVQEFPSIDAVPVIRCKDCRWWDKFGDYDNGYCMAAKHGYMSEHWEISIRRTYKGDFYCADAEPKGEQEWK